MSIEFTIRKGSTNPTSGSGITLGEPAFNYSNNTLFIGKGYGVTAAWVGAGICGASGGIAAGLTYEIPTLGAVKDYFTAVSSNFLGTTAAYVASFNGRTGAVQGVSAAVAGTGIAVSGATGSVTITNTGVLSFNGLTGAVTGVTAGGANIFTALNSFSAGLSAAGGVTFSGNFSGATATFSKLLTASAGVSASALTVTTIVSGGTSGILIQPGSGVLGISGDISVSGAIYGTVNQVNYIDFSDGTVRIGDPLGNDTNQFMYYDSGENTLFGNGSNLSFQAGIFSSSASIGDFVQIGAGNGIVNSGSTTLGTTAANQTISQSVLSTNYRSVEFFVQASTAGGAYEALKIMVVHDGTTTYNTQYGVVRSGATLGTYTTTLAGAGGVTRIRLRVTPTAVNTTYKVMITALPT